MVPSWWRHRRVARTRTRRAGDASAEPAAARGRRAAAATSAARWTLTCSGCCWGLPLAFALGWLASRLDLRQWQREQQRSPKAYYKGLNLLLNEQQDKAIDAFIEAVQHDPDTSELHFALGNLFRRRGEYERAVRVHEHLLQPRRPGRERARPRPARAGAGLHEGRPVRPRRGGLRRRSKAPPSTPRRGSRCSTCYERSRDWRAAVDDRAAARDAAAPARSPSRIAHYWCELALEADATRQTADADDALRAARARPRRSAARPLVLAGAARRARAATTREALRLLERADVGAAGRVQPGRARLRGERARRRRAGRGAASALHALYEQRADARPARGDRRSLEPDAGARRDAPAGPPARASDACRRRRRCCDRATAGVAAPAGPPRRASAARRRRRAPPGRCSAIAAPPAASRPSTTSGNARAAWAGTAIRRSGWRTSDERHADRANSSPRRACWSSATRCSTATGSARSSASRPRRRCRSCASTREEERLGGAANVACNVKTLGAQATLARPSSATTSPAAGSKRCSSESGIATLLQARPAALTTIVKLRVIGRSAAAAAHRLRERARPRSAGGMLADYERALRRRTTRCCSPTTARAA